MKMLDDITPGQASVLNRTVKVLSQNHRLVSIGSPEVHRIYGLWPRYEVTWTDCLDEQGRYRLGQFRTMWFARRAWNFAASFIEVHPNTVPVDHASAPGTAPLANAPGSE